MICELRFNYGGNADRRLPEREQQSGSVRSSRWLCREEPEEWNMGDFGGDIVENEGV